MSHSATDRHGLRCGTAAIALLSPPAAGLVQAGESDHPSDHPSVHPQAMQVDRLPEFLSNHPLLGMGLLAILGGIAWTFLQGSARGVRKLSPSDVTRLINHEDAIVLDVRSDGEFRQGHIVNALNIPDTQLADRIDKLNKYRERPIIATCRTGQVSAKAGGKLAAHGFEKVYSLSGGILAWESASLPLTRKK